MSTQQSPLGDTVSPQMLIYSLFQFRFHGKGKWESMRWGVSVLPRQSAGVEWEKPGCYVFRFCLFASFLFEKINTGNYKNSTESSNTHVTQCNDNINVNTWSKKFETTLLTIIWIPPFFTCIFLVYIFMKFYHMYRFVPPPLQSGHIIVPSPQRSSLSLSPYSHTLYHSCPLATITVIFSDCYISVNLRNSWGWLFFFTQHIFEIHPNCCMCQQFISFYYWIIILFSTD